MIALLLLAILVMVIVIPVAIVAGTRAATRMSDGIRYERPLLDPALDDRLSRIEEAIDAMALQIETLTQQHRALLGPGTETSGTMGQPPTE